MCQFHALEFRDDKYSKTRGFRASVFPEASIHETVTNLTFSNIKTSFPGSFNSIVKRAY